MKITVKKLIKAALPYVLVVAYRRAKPRLKNYKRMVDLRNERSKQFDELISGAETLRKVDNPKTVVSMTSYGKRVATTTPITVASILRQSVRPEKVVLWLAYGEKLPRQLRRLTKLGLEVEYYDDIKSYKKLIPSLKKYPNSTIITADDDIIYPKNWLENLIKEHNKYPTTIIANRAREIKLNGDSSVAPYSEWEIIENNIHSSKILPTGVGGVLYPKESLHPNVLNDDLFMRLAPHGDDLWFWAMAELKGTKRRIIENGFKDIDKHELDKVGLWNTINSTNGNDAQFLNIMENYPQLYKKIKAKNTKSEMTGLRLNPTIIRSEQQILFLKHQFAYEFAIEVATNMGAKSVLDYGCGDGYGSDLMATKMKDVLISGTDIDKEALSEAGKKYSNTNLRFVNLNSSGKYDLIVSFQVIEHVEDVKGYLLLLKKKLNKSGKIILATPDRRYRLNDGQKAWNPFHLREYTKSELREDIRSVFSDFTVYQLTGDIDMLRIEYSRVVGNREDGVIYGGVEPKLIDKNYTLDDFRLSKHETKDSLDLIAVINT